MANIRLPEHSHCVYCGNPVPFGEQFCNDECRRLESEKVAQQKKRDYLFFGVCAAVIVAIFVIRYLTL